jgi:hypothetical protein
LIADSAYWAYFKHLESVEEKGVDTIYHYTDESGLLGILNEKKIWLTDVDFQNDPNEISHGILSSSLFLLNKARDMINQQSLTEDDGLIILNFCETVSNRLNNILMLKKTDSLFTSSFSINGDSLTNWKGYGSYGKGFCIGFHPTIVNSLNCFSGIVRYTNKQKEELFEDFWLALIKDLKQKRDINSEEYISTFSTYLTMFSYYMKSEYFIDEGEFRITKTSFSDEFNQQVYLRNTKYGLTPYIKMDFCPQQEIKEIIIGPQLNFERNKKALIQYFNSNNLNIEVKKSIIELQ